MYKIKTTAVCAICVCCILIIQLSCKKESNNGLNDSSANNEGTSTTLSGKRGAISSSNTAEKLLSTASSSEQQSTSGSARTSNTASYNCGSNLSDYYYGTGYYNYAEYTLDASSLLNGSALVLNVYSYDVPNRFDVYDLNGNFVISSGWIGYADYSGPWGLSLNTGTNQALTIVKANPGSYKLRVSTSTRDYSDSWSANMACTNTGYSGVDLFKAIYFFDGHAATRIPYFASIKNYVSTFTPTQESQRQAFNNEIVSVINNLNPNFFDRFKQQIYSSDLDAINAIVDEGAGLLLVAVINSSYNPNYQQADYVGQTMNTSLYDFNTADGINTYLKDYGNTITNSNLVTKPDQSACVFFAGVVAVAVWDVVAVVNYGVIVNAAAVAVVYAAVYAKVVFWPRVTAEPTFVRLERERLIHDILVNISTNSGS
jgi:SdpC family antimicrobial peptide